jgi:hypothetical protein
LVIENHYLGDVLKKNQFDTFYHEHPRTYSLNSFYKISKLLKMHLHDFKFVKRYNGNIRVFISKLKNIKLQNKLRAKINEEKKLKKKINNFQSIVNNWKIKKREKLINLSKKYGPLIAKAFPARASILINLLKIDKSVISVVLEKDNSLKVNKYVPGTNIKIIKESLFLKNQLKKKIIINFAWHISHEIKDYLRYKLRIKNRIIDIIEKKDFK